MPKRRLESSESGVHGSRALAHIDIDHGGVEPVLNLEIAAQLLTAGSGIGILPAFCEVTTPALLRVFKDPVTVNTGWVVYHEAARETARVRAAVEVLVEFFDTHRSLFSGQPG